MARLSIKILEMKLHIQSSVKSIGKRKKNNIFFQNIIVKNYVQIKTAHINIMSKYTNKI
jgi:hypothetical protein